MCSHVMKEILEVVRLFLQQGIHESAAEDTVVQEGKVIGTLFRAGSEHIREKILELLTLEKKHGAAGMEQVVEKSSFLESGRKS